MQLKDKKLFRTQAFINGAWVDAASGATLPVIDPATGGQIGTVPEMDVNDTRQAIAAAHGALEEWRKTTTKTRHRILSKWAQLMLEHKDDLATIMTLENGKVSAKGEVVYAQSFVEWFAEEAKRIYGDVIPAPDGGQRCLVVKQPVGVCSIITPWNFPSAMITRKAGAALAAGCTVVIKPAAETPYSALALVELAIRAGVPNGVINIVTTDKHIKDVGHLLCTSDFVSKVSFTGSTSIGKLIMQQCSSGIKRVSLELGGNAPFVVFDDADPEAVVEGLMNSKLRNAGQVCVAPNRIYVQSGIHERLSQLLVARLEKLRVGGGFVENVHVGPLISEQARRKVLEHIEDAVKRGGRVLLDGRQRQIEDITHEGGFFVHPTIISELPTDALVNAEETFGPLLAMSIFDTEEEAIKLANNTKAGLSAYVYTRDISRVFRVSEAIEAGMLSINGAVISSAVTPFGGLKESGIGYEGSKYGVEEYVSKKLIAIGIEEKARI
ncbi:succinate-semialdehyde dehydrogenase I [Thamnocephalis sphaerospora]|uniref:Succinate-semialdehyde dehydrogenase, mitochondrial n=1 Tax=Thamnocephalis sphaerospora TaxID=78915 RepID=A0A4P9XNY0_9FUNG|nr:succinate-semialdehyde dehydrogenase I [Thamnocephalis sphaerospora]|eukprot:RKP07665.1 succinate-semialdehyde dehydrogenase I [Thamnocephalis sphaerospora]